MLKNAVDVAIKLDFNITEDYLTCRVSFVRLNGDEIRRYDENNAELRNVSACAQADKCDGKSYFYGYDDSGVVWLTYQNSINESDAEEAAHTLVRINRKLTALKGSLGSATFGEYVLRVAKVLKVETYLRGNDAYPVSWARDDIERKLREFAQ